MKAHLRHARFCLLALACVLGSLAGSASAQQDRITLKDGKQMVAKILSEDFDGLSYSLEGGSAGKRWDDIESIRYGSADKYYSALDLYNGGKLEESLPGFKELAADAKQRPVLRQNALYYQGQAHERLNQSDEAIAAYSQLLNDFPKSRYLLDVGSRLLAINLAKGDASNASRVIDEAVKKAQAAGMATGMQAGFGLLRGKLLEAQGKFDEASTLYSSTASASDASADVAMAGKLGVARCSQGAGRASQAESGYRELLGQDAPSDVLAGAWNGLGDLSFEPAIAKRDMEGLTDGLLAYLRGVVLYVPVRGAPSSEHERSLAGASKAFRAIGELEKTPERKKLYMDRAKACRDQLAGLYPNSPRLKEL